MEDLCEAIAQASPVCPRIFAYSVALELLHKENSDVGEDATASCKRLAHAKKKLLRKEITEALEKIKADFLEGEELRGRLPDNDLAKGGPMRGRHVSKGKNVTLAALSYNICVRLAAHGSLLEMAGSEAGKKDGHSTEPARKFLLPSPASAGVAAPLPGWLVEHRTSREHERRLAKAIKRGEHGLCEDKYGVALGPDIDFGIKRAAAAISPGDREGEAGPPWEDAAARYYRSSWAANHSTAPVMLVDITAAPAMPGRITVHDDLRLADNHSHHHHDRGCERGPSAERGAKEAPLGLVLKQGAVYQVTCHRGQAVLPSVPPAPLRRLPRHFHRRRAASDAPLPPPIPRPRGAGCARDGNRVRVAGVDLLSLRLSQGSLHPLSRRGGDPTFAPSASPTLLSASDVDSPGDSPREENTSAPAGFCTPPFPAPPSQDAPFPQEPSAPHDPAPSQSPTRSLPIHPHAYAPPPRSTRPPTHPKRHQPSSDPRPHLPSALAARPHPPPISTSREPEAAGLGTSLVRPVPYDPPPPAHPAPDPEPANRPPEPATRPAPLPHVLQQSPGSHVALDSLRPHRLPLRSPRAESPCQRRPFRASGPEEPPKGGGGGRGWGFGNPATAFRGGVEGHQRGAGADGDGEQTAGGSSTAPDDVVDADVAASASAANDLWCPCVRQQLRQLARLLAVEELTMERDIKMYDIFYAKLARHDAPRRGPDQPQLLFCLQVPGLAENRPSVMVGDVVYLRPAVQSALECAATVHAVELRPSPQLILAITPEFHARVQPATGPGSREGAFEQSTFHVRFTFDRQPLVRMHAALASAATSRLQLLPCMCLARSRLVDPCPSELPDELDFGGGSCGPSLTPAASPDHAAREGELPPPPLPLDIGRLDLFNKTLNNEQQHAVRNFLEARRGPGPYLTFGPPGTGKTVTLVECVLQALKLIPMARLCVCAPSNYAADILCSGIAAGGVSPKDMWRLNDPRRTMASVKSDVVRYCSYDSELGMFDVRDDARQFRVIVCTCGAAGLLRDRALWPPERSPSASTGIFSHILIDEAGQALIPETLIALTLGGPSSALLLCGDPKQLGPIVHSPLASLHGFSQSLLERFMLSASYEAELRRHGTSSLVVKLLRNYRSNSDLLVVPSLLFYGGELIASAEKNGVAPPSEWEEMQSSEFPILFYGVKGQQMREGEAPSFFNPVEASRLVDLLVGLLARTSVTVQDIGVMAPYRLQVQKLRLLLRSRGLSAVRVGNIDDYQGQEEKVIFISTVLTRPESLRKVGARQVDSNLGFLGNAKRFNVAITRAKALLVVVGHPLVLLEDDNWRELLKFCKSKNAYRGAGAELVPSWGPEPDGRSVISPPPTRGAPKGSSSSSMKVKGRWHAAAAKPGGSAKGAKTKDLSGREGKASVDTEGYVIVDGPSDAVNGSFVEGEEGEQPDRPEAENLEETLDRMAEMYLLLGEGDADKIFPSESEALWSANLDGEPEFRVML